MCVYVCVTFLKAGCCVLQAIFMIPTNPPPTFRTPDLWSESFQDFIGQCLVKIPENRATATQLLQVTGSSRDGQRHRPIDGSVSVDPLILCLRPSASIHQDIKAQLHPQNPDQRRHGDQSEATTGGGAERSGRGGRG